MTVTAGELLVDVLRSAGVDTAFGIVSIHNLPLVEAVSEHLRFVPVRTEAAAVNAADGYARARGGLGCAITSTGTGAGNAAGALIEALAAGSSVLHVTGQIPTQYLGQQRGFIHETKDQLGMLTAVSKRAFSIASADEAPRMLADAVRLATAAPGGPVSVEWPIDLQYHLHESVLAPSASMPAPLPPAALVADAVERLRQSRRPVLWLGGGARAAGPQVRALVERLALPVLTSNAGRGVLTEEHLLCIGNYASSDPAQDLLLDADLVLSIGTHFRSNETRSYALRLPAEHIQVDIDADAIGRVYPATIGLVGDAAAVLTSIVDQLDSVSVLPEWTARAADVREQVRAKQRGDLGAHAEISDAIEAAAPAGSIIARDVTIPSSTWGNRLLPITDHRSNVFARGGGIGQGLAMGIGASIGRPDVPTVVIVGDGGLAVSLGELLTLAQESPRLILCVFNDGGYGVLRNLQESMGKPRAGVDLHVPSFRGLAEAIGLDFAQVTRADTMADALRESLLRSGPTLIEIDVNALGPMPSAFVPPVEVPTTPEGAVV